LDLTSNRFITDVYGNSGDHRMNGLYIAAGPNIRPGTRLERARIIDIAPTMLYLLGHAVPDDMDGEVLTDMISDEFLRANPINTTEGLAADRDLDVVFSDEESEEVRERLKSLGYF